MSCRRGAVFALLVTNKHHLTVVTVNWHMEKLIKMKPKGNSINCPQGVAATDLILSFLLWKLHVLSQNKETLISCYSWENESQKDLLHSSLTCWSSQTIWNSAVLIYASEVFKFWWMRCGHIVALWCRASGVQVSAVRCAAGGLRVRLCMYHPYPIITPTEAWPPAATSQRSWSLPTARKQEASSL